MPNWCYNTLTLQHDNAEVLDKVEKGYLDGKLLETLVPYEGEWDYDWSMANWGIKWDVSPCGHTRASPNELSVTFDSAWGPPIIAYETLIQQGFNIRTLFYEPGMAFAGIWENGYDETYDLASMSMDEIRSLPVELDEEFNIVEQMEENHV